MIWKTFLNSKQKVNRQWKKDILQATAAKLQGQLIGLKFQDNKNEYCPIWNISHCDKSTPPSS